MVLKNTGEVDVSVRPRFFSAAGEDGNLVELPTMTLRPQQIVDVDLRTLREAAASRPDFDSVSVQVLNSGAPGSLIGALYSTDRTTQLTYDVPLRDSGKMRNSTGSYPWRVDGDYTTIVNITNVTGQPASFIVDIRYPGGHYFLPSREIAAGGTATFDLRELISEQKADNKGDVIPLSTKGGQFHWSVFGGAASSKFIGRSEVVSLFQRVSSSYSCPSCCPDSGPFGGIDTPGPVFIGGLTTVGTHSEMVDCNGYTTSTGNLWMNWWWLSDYNMASCSPTSGVSTDVQGLSTGQTYINAYYSFYSWDPGPEDCFRSTNDTGDSQPVDVVPDRILLNDVTVFERGAQFNRFLNIANLSLQGSSHESDTCGSNASSPFEIRVHFLLPPGASLAHDRCTADGFDDIPEWIVTGSTTCTIESGRTGRLVFSAFRGGGNDDNPKITIVVGGDSQNGARIDTRGTINLTCTR